MGLLFLPAGDPILSFKHKQYPKDIILMAVRWYVAYSLSYRDIEELLLERGFHIDHATIDHWVIVYAPQLEKMFSRKNKRATGSSWRGSLSI